MCRRCEQLVPSDTRCHHVCSGLWTSFDRSWMVGRWNTVIAMCVGTKAIAAACALGVACGTTTHVSNRYSRWIHQQALTDLACRQPASRYASHCCPPGPLSLTRAQRMELFLMRQRRKKDRGAPIPQSSPGKMSPTIFCLKSL